MTRKTDPAASQSLLQELAHARQGLAFYQKRVDSLTKKVGKLGIDPSGRGRRDPNLPQTNGDFWVSVVARRPRTHQQVIEAALKKLKLEDPSPEVVRKLRLRWSVVLIDLVATGRIKDSGQGRERRFFLPEE